LQDETCEKMKGRTDIHILVLPIVSSYILSKGSVIVGVAQCSELSYGLDDEGRDFVSLCHRVQTAPGAQ
jgi:hypothetical protein